MRFTGSRETRLLSVSWLIVGSLCLTFLAMSIEESLAAPSEEEGMAKLVEGAKKEGKLVLYTTMEGEHGEVIFRGFKKKYPFIEPGLVRSGGTRLVTRLMAETRAGKRLSDVIEHAGFYGEIFKREGLYAKYIHPHWKYFAEGFKDPEGYWTSSYSNLIVIAYNRNSVSPREAPKTYEDLLNPRWKGKMGMVANSESWFSFMLKVMGEEKGLEYFRKLAEQNIQWREGATLNTQLVAAGELDIGIRLYNYRVQLLKEQGAAIEWVAQEPIVAEIHPIGVAAHAPHPNAARLFIDYILSKEAQTIVANDLRRIPDRIDVDTPVPELKCRGKNIVAFDPSIVDDYERYLKLFRKVLLKK